MLLHKFGTAYYKRKRSAMMKQFLSRSNRIGGYTNIICLFMVLLLLSSSNLNALSEANPPKTVYHYGDFSIYLSLPDRNVSGDIFTQTINIADCRNLSISVQTLLTAFPNNAIDREITTNIGSQRYVAYDLDDGSRMFIFINNDLLTNVCCLEPMCTVDEFAKIETGLSSPYDVARIDRNAVFNPFIEWGPVSYHCLNDGSFYRIQYRQSSHSAEEYTVNDVTIIQKDECLNVLSAICPDDLPYV